MSVAFFSENKRKLRDLISTTLPNKQETKTPPYIGGVFVGGDKRDRTADLLNAIHALSQDTQNYTPDDGLESIIGGCLLISLILQNISIGY